MFTELQLSGELRLRLAGAVVNGACIDQAGMSLALRLTTRAELGDAELEELKHLLMGVYGFRQVTTEVTCKAPSSQAAAAGSRPAASVPAAPSGSKGEKQAAGKVLMGKPIRIQPVPMKILDLKMGNATVAGNSLTGWSRQIHAEFLVLRATQDTTMLRQHTNTQLSCSMVFLSRKFFSDVFMQRRSPTTPIMP